MLINTFLDTEDFVHLYYPEDETPGPQGCGAGARLASKYPRPPTPEYKQGQFQLTETQFQIGSQLIGTSAVNLNILNIRNFYEIQSEFHNCVKIN
ncbi:unnamed protein product [Euphydryas editha]|uniref:Uncharacterized protein n=1 Tax=Euphydryas editha TaxID=104508 RepID=A0AAU9U8J1_EUPED|nr:unnamed protein product [Euphydryas editha]